MTGTWNADTIVNGTRYDSCGIFTGHMNKWMLACGHGSYTYADRTTYEGRFEDDREDGFGVAINTTSLKAGEWSNGKFRGERMQYTFERSSRTSAASGITALSKYFGSGFAVTRVPV